MLVCECNGLKCTKWIKMLEFIISPSLAEQCYYNILVQGHFVPWAVLLY